MFPARYFPARYFPTRFWAKVGAAMVAFTAAIWRTVDVAQRIRRVVVSQHERTVTVPNRGRKDVRHV